MRQNGFHRLSRPASYRRITLRWLGTDRLGEPPTAGAGAVPETAAPAHPALAVALCFPDRRRDGAGEFRWGFHMRQMPLSGQSDDAGLR